MHPSKPTRWASGLLPLSRTLEVYKTAKHYVVAESRVLMTLYVFAAHHPNLPRSDMTVLWEISPAGQVARPSYNTENSVAVSSP